LLPVTHERGYLIPAIGDVYEACAEQLKHSILHFHPDAHVTILTKNMLPHGDLGGWANDWQCWHASPYRQTIKLEADQICASAIDHWWDLLALRDVVISLGCRDYFDQPGLARTYRKVFDANHLPDVYNGITYWRLSTTAQQFFNLVRNIFENWSQYKCLLKFSEDLASTDVVYAMATQIMGPEQVTLPAGLGPNMVHMKRDINQLQVDNWTDQLIWETDPVRINTVAQWGLVHYHNKLWRHDQHE
jgi:hypothetical protein